MKFLLMLLLLSSSAAAWQIENPPIQVRGNSSYFNGEVISLSDSRFEFRSHQNPGCMGVTQSRCRKALIGADRLPFELNTIERFQFDFQVEYNDFPDFLIIFQDWVRIHADDTNGNRPITTIKLRRSEGQLYIQHWENSWQWGQYPGALKYDQHLVPGRETMHGEAPIKPGELVSVQLKIAHRGYVQMYVDGVLISDAVYRTTHYEQTHQVMLGMYWSKGFNVNHDPAQTLRLSLFNFQYDTLSH